MTFVKGQSGNPGGRPKADLADAIRRELHRKGPDGTVNRAAIARKLVELAVTGNLEAVKVVLDRVDGKVPEFRTVEGAVSIVLSWDDGRSD